MKDYIGAVISVFLMGMLTGLLVSIPLSNIKTRRIAVEEKRGIWTIDAQTGKKTFVYYKPSTNLFTK